MGGSCFVILGAGASFDDSYDSSLFLHGFGAFGSRPRLLDRGAAPRVRTCRPVPSKPERRNGPIRGPCLDATTRMSLKLRLRHSASLLGKVYAIPRGPTSDFPASTSAI